MASVSDITPMFKSLPLLSRWSHRPTTTLAASSSLRVEVVPPTLRCAPVAAADSTWQRLLFWLLAPAPQDAAPPPDRLPRVRTDFLATLADIDNADAERARCRIHEARTLRELWHARTEVYRVVAVAHSQWQAEERVALLNRHFPTRSPRSGFAPL
jgi:hypothetical protein